MISETRHGVPKRPEIRFVVDRNLGKLVKWLRILGFDTLYEPELSSVAYQKAPTQGRIAIGKTRSGPLHGSGTNLIRIQSDLPFEQVQEVIKTLNLKASAIKPFSRCVRCNLPIQIADPDMVIKKAPDYIRETHKTFFCCPRCERIYWPGSHLKNSRAIIDKWFKKNGTIVQSL